MSILRLAGTEHAPRAVRKLANGWYWHSRSEPPHAVAAFAAGCRCGWQSSVEHTGTGSEHALAALAEWCEEHIRPLAERVGAIVPAALSVAPRLGLSDDVDGARGFVDVVVLSTMSAEITRALEWRVNALREGGAHWSTIAAALGVGEEAARATYAGAAG